MHRYYAYLPTPEGGEPLGTSNRIVFDAVSDRGARQVVRNRFSRAEVPNVRLFRTPNFYDETSWRRVL